MNHTLILQNATPPGVYSISEKTLEARTLLINSTQHRINNTSKNMGIHVFFHGKCSRQVCYSFVEPGKLSYFVYF